MSQEDFEEYCMLPAEVKKKDVFSLQIDRKSNQGQPLRCDFRRLRDTRGRVTGNLFVFTDAANDTDILTGFQHWENFRRFAVENPYNFDHPTSAVVFDIVGLSEINRTFGREVGNQRIRNLAKVIRTNMPRDAFFVRGYEAHLLAICSHCTEDELAGCVRQVIEACNGTVMYGMSATSDPVRIGSDGYPRSSLKMTEGEESRNIIKAIATASRTLQVKKLLSSSSAHSQTITSLVRALQESDSDTEAHVQRTQKMGALLGKRIGLNDAQLADLNLLCLLHDIGKIGIPLEILNKPDRLSEREWVVMKTHSEKGYQIAMSSEELKPIARMILYHHERWDGKGYPERLAGSSIPILSRIISVVDAYDAMVNDRAYRKGFPPAVAQEELSRCAGTQFDPYLVGEFLKMLADNPDIAAGERTDAPEIRVFRRAELEEAETGSTLPVSYSRYFLDLEDTIIEVDDGFQEITGYSGAEAVGIMNQIALIPAEDRADYMIQVNNQFALGSDSAFLEHNIERKDGMVVRVLCHGKRYYDSASRSYRSEILITQI